MEVYVSTGEPFRDPLKDMQRMFICKRVLIVWTSLSLTYLLHFEIQHILNSLL